MRILKDDCMALVIDVQDKLVPHMYQKEELVESIKKLINGINLLTLPVVVSEQYRKGLGATIEEISKIIIDFDPLEKKSFSCMDENSLRESIIETNKKFVIISGIETHICVMQTAIDLLAMGMIPVIVEDAIASRRDNDKKIAIERLRKEGAIITTVESILFELTRYSTDEVFKGISKLIK